MAYLFAKWSIYFYFLSSSFFPFSLFFSKSLPKPLFHPYASLKMGKKIGQKLAIFWSNFCPQTTTSCGQALLFLLFSTILHHYYTLDCFFFVPKNCIGKLTIIIHRELETHRLNNLSVFLFIFKYLHFM